MNTRQLYSLALAASLLIAVVCALAIWVTSDDADDAPAARLAALPAGDPRLLALTGIVERVPQQELLDRPEIVFVGEVTDVGGSEVVTPAGAQDEPFLLTRHRVRFAISKPLRGTDDAWIDVSLLDLPEANVDFAVGKQYLVFAHRTELGTTRTPAVVPDGYAQGVYTVVGDDMATNAVNGTLSLPRLEELLR